MSAPTFLIVDAAHFEVAYVINPWMSPGAWQAQSGTIRRAARASSDDLRAALIEAGARLEILQGEAGAPDLVFPANAAVVLDGRAILARFSHPERQVEEPIFRRVFEALRRRGLLREVAELDDGNIQEGAGDCIWDASRGLFWAGHGQRSNRRGMEQVIAFFAREAVALELATPRFYHLDTCFCPLPGGEILYYPPAFTAEALRTIKDRVPHDMLIEASDDDAARFCVNAVCIDRTIIMAKAADRLRCILKERDYHVSDIDLSPFILSGGGAFCMTLRLDRTSDILVSAAREATQ